MKFGKVLSLSIIILVGSVSITNALPSFGGKLIGFYPITNEVSLYQSVDDSGLDRGRTLQIVSINQFKIFTSFNFEFTGDFNWNMSSLDKDHYVELSIVKPILPRISINFQRIISSFETKSVNQFGLRVSF